MSPTTASSLAAALTALEPMPSASATATPFDESGGPVGIVAPWKSWLASLRPRSEYWPTRTASMLSGSGHAADRYFALRQRLHVRGVERETREGEAAHEV